MAVVLLLAACDKGPIQEHRIDYEKGGLGSRGPVTWRIEVDLDKRILVSRADVVTQRELSESETKFLKELAGAARDEPDGPRATVSDSYERITLLGDKRRDIENTGPMTVPVAAKLEERLETLAGWRTPPTR